MPFREVRVWDPVVRTGHWLLAACVLVAWLFGEPLRMHTWVGYLVAIVVALRVRGVGLASLACQENSVLAMIAGRKRAD